MLQENGIRPDQFEAFLRHLGGSAVEFSAGQGERRDYVVTVAHGGEQHRYGAHDIRILAYREGVAP